MLIQPIIGSPLCFAVLRQKLDPYSVVIPSLAKIRHREFLPVG